ncbi:DNA helicase RecQ [Clostridium sediminicola]|uniref:DNA helicase RecQ n=1 Tax=Clostridium sediminicola TaxID=3114879 RepID=UPI0031F2366C
MIENAQKALKTYFGYDSFRQGQKEVIYDVLDNRDVVAIMPTGAGKSMCFQVPAVLFDGITIVISPLISLMKDQVDSLKEAGINATFINSTLSTTEINNRMFRILSGDYKLVYVAPERLESRNFVDTLCNMNISFVAIDEAHCISQWGHDFRPSYRKVSNFIRNIQPRPIVGAFTATATEKVKNDIINLLNLNEPSIYVTGFDRENLSFTVLKGENRESFILDYLDKNKGLTGIIYTSTRKAADNIYNLLIKNGIKAGVYHAGLSDEERSETQNKFAYDDIDVVVATNAFGMGIDKSNVRFVIHNNIPKNMEAYYQEAGRAGRDGEKAECILLFAPRDIQLQAYFIEESMMSPERKINEYEKLRAMVDYCHTSKCLRQYILEYFGDTLETDNCANCSNCNDDSELVDITLEAQKIFSCIYRMQQRYGSGMVADVLKGSTNKKLRQWNLNVLSTYGIMKQHTKKEIVDIINKLTADNYLNLTNDAYPVLKLTNKAVGVLKNGDKVEMKAVKATKRLSTDNELFELLRSLRKEISSKENVPPYIVFSDASLKEMSTYMPTNKIEMLNVKGVGNAKFERYGQDFISAINEYVEEKKIDISSFRKPLKEGIDSEKVLNIDSSKNSDKTPSHVITFEMFNEGKSIEEIVKDRDLKKRTAESHIIRSLQEGMETDVKRIVPENYIPMIVEAIKNCEEDKLTPVKEKLPEEVEFFWISLVKYGVM